MLGNSSSDLNRGVTTLKILGAVFGVVIVAIGLYFGVQYIQDHQSDGIVSSAQRPTVPSTPALATTTTRGTDADMSSHCQLPYGMTIATTSRGMSKSFVTIDQSALISSSTHPCISGTYNNMTDRALEIVIMKGVVSMPKVSDSTDTRIVWDDFTDHGGMLQMGPTSDAGTWMDYVSDTMDPGVYTIGIYAYSNIYRPAPEYGYVGDTEHTLLKSGTLTVGK